MIQCKEIRLRKGYTQEQVAQYLMISRAAYTNIENGKRDPDTKTLQMLSDLFDVTVDELLGLNVDEKDKRTKSSPKTFEARIISGLADSLPHNERKRLLNVVQAMYANYPDLFDYEKKGDDDEA